MLNKTKLKKRKKHIASQLINNNSDDVLYLKECLVKIQLMFGDEKADEFLSKFLDNYSKKIKIN